MIEARTCAMVSSMKYG